MNSAFTFRPMKQPHTGADLLAMCCRHRYNMVRLLVVIGPSMPRRPKSKAAKLNAVAIADEVSKLIEDRILQPGERIREQELADKFGTSRGPVREALKMLASRFQVHIEPNIGAMVPHLSPEEVIEIHQIRGSLLGIAAGWAALRASNEELEELLSGARELHEIASGDCTTGEFISLTNKWRRKLVAAAHSKRIEGNYAVSGFGGASFLWETRWGTPNKRTDVARKWVECAEALSNRDGDTAATIAVDIYDGIAKEIRRFILGEAS